MDWENKKSLDITSGQLFERNRDKNINMFKSMIDSEHEVEKDTRITECEVNTWRFGIHDDNNSSKEKIHESLTAYFDKLLIRNEYIVIYNTFGGLVTNPIDFHKQVTTITLRMRLVGKEELAERIEELAI